MKKFLLGFKYAWQGLVYAFTTQLNFKFHTVAAVLVIALGYVVKLDKAEWLWISTAVVLVLVAELFNTALEVLVDLVSPDYNPKAGLIKDLASGAVLLIAGLAAIIGLCIFLPKLV